jgi:NADH:ubiquinone oxidoreductase subunit 6 (subunit J)
MNTLILFTHIILAVITLAFSAGVIFGKDTLRSMWASFAGLIVSGAVLTLGSPHAFGKVCLMTAGYVLLLSMARLYSIKKPTKSVLD